MSLEIEGKLFQVLEGVTGDGRNGKWFKQDFVVEVPGEYPKNVCFTVWGEDKARVLTSLKNGDSVKVSFDISSREFKGKWYTEAKAWKIEAGGASSGQGQTHKYAAKNAPPPLTASDIPAEPAEDDDLPF